MNLIFYKTGFDITKNGVYDGLDDYLGSLDFFSVPGYKYIEPSLATTVKIPYDSHQRKKTFDYCAMVDGNEVYYYYVTNMKWRGKETLELSLAFDTLNTYWSEIKSGLTDETHITRRFKDRYVIGENVAYPVVDNKQEDFSSVPMERKSIEKVNPLSSTQKWYLAYMTDYSQTESNLSENPVTCYAIPENTTNVETKRNGSVTWDSSMFASNKAYATTYALDPEFTLEVWSGDTKTFDFGFEPTTNRTTWVYVLWSETLKKFYVKYCYWSPTKIYIAEKEGDKIVFTSCKKMYVQDWTFADNISPTGTLEPQAGEIAVDSYITVDAGGQFSTLMRFKEWYDAYKTNSTLVKLREIPYAPFPEVYANGSLIVQDGWEISNQRLKFTGNAFSEITLRTVNAVDMEVLTKDEVIDQVDEGLFETKMLNSAYNLSKFVYDTQTWAVQPERLWSFDDEGKGKVVVNYKVSDGMDNGSIFRFQNDQTQDTDFGEFMVIDKSTDLPYFTNEYLNYLRYGKKIDEKNARWSLVSSMLSSGGSMLSTVASGAFGLSAAGASGMAGGIIGGVLGLAGSVVSIAKTADTYRDEINSKIDAYTHQASSVTGTSDVSLFNVYSGNKLLLMKYAPKQDVKEMLLDYFRFYGYADDCYGIPNFDSRRWVDYVKCEPVFQNDMVWNDFLDDIKARMQAGFHIFHRVGGNYDLKINQENWETSLWTWAHQE